MSFAVYSAVDVALWFMDRALDDNEYLQPQKLHRLLYLAQAYYGVAYHSRPLMPAIFIAEELGPVEPNLFRLFEQMRPSLERRRIPDSTAHFLDSIWRRFGQHSADHLSKVITGHPPYKEARLRGKLSEIPFEATVAFYADPRGASRAETPAVEDVLRPRVLRSQTGKPVSVKAWLPSKAPTTPKK